MLKKLILSFLIFYLIISKASANDEVNNKIFYQKYDKKVQKIIHSLPEINEAAMGNHQLVVRSKNSIDDKKWKYDYYPFYWTKIGTIDFDNSYIIIQSNKTGFAENKYAINALEYDKNNSIIGFTKTNILKNTKTKKNIIGFKYAINKVISKNDKEWQVANLQHIIIIDMDIKNNNFIQIIYNSNATPICYQINDKKYINPDNENLLFEQDFFKPDANDSFIKTFFKGVKKATSNSFAFIVWLIKGD